MLALGRARIQNESDTESPALRKSWMFPVGVSHVTAHPTIGGVH